MAVLPRGDLVIPHTCLFRLFILLFCLIVIVQAGCSKPLYWAKPNAGAGEFERDLATCQQRMPGQGERAELSGLAKISASFGTDSVILEQCLAEKGWFLVRRPTD